jgi:hypothetical protein
MDTRSRWWSAPGSGTTTRCCPRCWKLARSGGLVGGVGHASGRLGSLVTRATRLPTPGSTCAVGGSGRSSHPQQSAAQPALDRDAYRLRNQIERCFNRLKHFRRVATRWEKRAVNYLAMVTRAAIMDWL